MSPDSGETVPGPTPMPGRYPRHQSALLNEAGTGSPIHEMARSVWALGLEVPAEVHEHVLGNWEAVLAYIAGMERGLDGR